MRQGVSCSKQWVAIAVIGVLLGAAGCSGNGEGLDENGRPLDESGAPPPGLSQFQQIQDTILTPACTSCHSGASAPRGLRLDAGNSYAMLVGVASSEVPSLQRVQPGNAESSYLVHKIEGRAAVGARMPLGGPPLSQANIDLIKQWIVAGAPAPSADAPQSTLTKAQPLQLVSAVPAHGEIAQSVGELMLVFNHPVDTALAQAGAFELLASGGDGSFGDGNETAVELEQVNVSLVNPTVVYLKPRTVLTLETYRLSLRGEGTTVLADVGSRVLDGNGDGFSGDDAIVQFTVEAK